MFVSNKTGEILYRKSMRRIFSFFTKINEIFANKRNSKKHVQLILVWKYALLKNLMFSTLNQKRCLFSLVPHSIHNYRDLAIKGNIHQYWSLTSSCRSLSNLRVRLLILIYYAYRYPHLSNYLGTTLI